MVRIVIFIAIMFPVILLSGCSDTGTPKPTMEQQRQQQYAQQGRTQKYYELKERYDSRLVLWLNREEDKWWITNFTAWFATLIFDIPDLAATGAIVGVIYVVAWFGSSHYQQNHKSEELTCRSRPTTRRRAFLVLFWALWRRVSA